jgi:hypothetical protein
MDSITTPNHFDRGKPFYPLVMNYIVQLIGFKELAVRGVVRTQPYSGEILREIVKKLAGASAPDESMQEHTLKQVEEVTTQLSKLLGPLELRSEFQGNRISIDIDAIANELATNFNYLLPYTLRAAGHLLILAHEICKDEPYHDQGPLWEFLRHCRNAAAHGGTFTFLNNEPRRLAQWGHIEIIGSLQGTPLFKGENGKGFLSPGDPIRLLWDIEQAYPSMKA